MQRNGTLPKIGVPYFGVLIIRILLSRVLHWGPLFSETPKWLGLRYLRCSMLVHRYPFLPCIYVVGALTFALMHVDMHPW